MNASLTKYLSNWVTRYLSSDESGIFGNDQQNMMLSVAALVMCSDENG